MRDGAGQCRAARRTTCCRRTFAPSACLPFWRRSVSEARKHLPRRKSQVTDPGLQEERVTRTELAHSAWEIASTEDQLQALTCSDGRFGASAGSAAFTVSMTGPRKPRASPCRSCSVAAEVFARHGSMRGHDHLRYRSSRWFRDVGWWKGRSPDRDGVAGWRRTMSTCGATRRTSSVSPWPCFFFAASRDQPADRLLGRPPKAEGQARRRNRGLLRGVLIDHDC